VDAIRLPLDRAMCARLAGVMNEATEAFDRYDYARALERTEAFFWWFCDDYLELVKTRAYGDPSAEGPASARAALALALSVQLRLFAPILPFVTEEVWSWWNQGSVHLAAWPSSEDLGAATSGTEGSLLDVVSDVLGAVRRTKTSAKRSMRAEVTVLTVTDTDERLAALAGAIDDLRDAGGVVTFTAVVGEEHSVDVQLADEEPPVS
jgi:valyl-tRNA synthetase